MTVAVKKYIGKQDSLQYIKKEIHHITIMFTKRKDSQDGKLC